MSDDASGTDQAAVANERLLSLLQGIQRETRFDHPVARFQLIATHISYVLLAGPYAYKFKRPLDLGFLDFTTLDKRRSCCEEELRLNRRLAPQLYLEVVPITGSAAAPVLRGTGPVIEYCVKMMKFPQEAQLDRVLKRGELTACHVDDLGDGRAVALRWRYAARGLGRGPRGGFIDRVVRSARHGAKPIRKLEWGHRLGTRAHRQWCTVTNASPKPLTHPDWARVVWTMMAPRLSGAQCEPHSPTICLALTRFFGLRSHRNREPSVPT